MVKSIYNTFFQNVKIKSVIDFCIRIAKSMEKNKKNPFFENYIFESVVLKSIKIQRVKVDKLTLSLCITL